MLILQIFYLHSIPKKSYTCISNCICVFSDYYLENGMGKILAVFFLSMVNPRNLMATFFNRLLWLIPTKS